MSSQNCKAHDKKKADDHHETPTQLLRTALANISEGVLTQLLEPLILIKYSVSLEKKEKHLPILQDLENVT